MSQDAVGFQTPYDTGIPDLLQTIAENTGESVNHLIVVALTEKLRKDGFLQGAGQH